MSRKFVTDLDLSKNQLLNLRLQNLTTDPSSPVAGQAYYNSTSNTIRYYDGTTWQTLGTGTGSGNVTKAANSGAANTLQVSGSTDKSIADYAPGTAGLLKTSSAGVPSVATVGTDYVTGSSTNAFTNKSFDANGTGNSITNLEVADFLTGVVQTTISGSSTNTQIATALAVYNFVQAAFGANDAMVIKGGIDASTNPNFPAANAGDTYRITVAGKIGGASGPNVEVGDMIICFVDGSAAGTFASVGANWIIEQTNLDAASTTVSGYTRYATTAEAAAKSIATAAVTPAGLATFTQKFSATVGDGTATSIAVTHNLNSRDVTVAVYDSTTYAVVECDVTMTSVNVVTLGFSTAPASGAYRAVVVG